MEALQSKQTYRAAQLLGSQKIFGGLLTLVIREHSPGSVVSQMALYYSQFKHAKFE